MSMDVQTSMRLPADLLERADALIATLQSDPSLSMMGKITRSKVLRLALSEGLAALEAQHRFRSSSAESRPRASLTRTRAHADPPAAPAHDRERTSPATAHTGGQSMTMEED